MKISHFITILLIYFLYSSCKKEEDVRRISTKISHSFIFDVKEGELRDIYLNETIDASQDPTLQPFLANIINYKMNKITVMRSDYREENASDVVLNGFFYDREPTFMGSTFFFGFDSVNLDPTEDQDPKGLEIEIFRDNIVNQDIANLFNEDHKFNLKFKGTISDAPLYYVITFSFYLEATVPL
jgi:hypothetical protein